MESLTEPVLALAGSMWIFPVALVLTIVDGFFPPVPSESVIVAVAALSAHHDPVRMVPLFAVAALGAWLGDNIAYAIGRRVGLAGLHRRPRIAATIDWAHDHLVRRGALVIFTARYIPVGRVAVNMTAGAVDYGARRFATMTAFSGVCWAAYSVAIGALAANWAKHNPLLAAGLAIAIALVLGIIMDAVMRHIGQRQARSVTGPSRPRQASRR